MWRADLKHSFYQPIIISVVYLILGILLILALDSTYLDDGLFMLILLVTVEWWRAYRGCKTMHGELALFIQTNEIYWFRRRWHITKAPLFLRYVIVLQLTSKKNGKKRILWVMNDNFNQQDWRSFNYFLRQLMNI